MKISDYQVCVGNGPEALVAEVNAYLVQGYVPCGGVVVMKLFPDDVWRLLYAQAIMKLAEDSA